MMLTLTASKSVGRFCDGISRRRFLQIGVGAGLTLPQILAAQAQNGGARAKSIIMIFLAGGPPHLDTFDLKPEAPAEIRGELKPIRTNVAGIEICELMPRLARVADKFTLVRSLHGMPNRHESHSCFSGWSEPEIGRNHHPALGSVVAKLRGEPLAPVPAFMSLVRKPGHAPWGNPGEPGFLGASCSPFQVDDKGAGILTLHGSLDQLRQRKELLDKLDSLRDSTDPLIAQMGVHQQRAFAMLTSSAVAEALDLSREPESVRARYGRSSLEPVLDGPPANPLDFLLARRLIEAGVRCVTLSFCRWDWHDRNFVQARQYIPVFDQALAALLEDLAERGLDREVLVLAVGEFGRTPRINKDAGRDHWVDANSALLAGGGLRCGQVVGATDPRGERPKTRPVHFQQLLATCYHALGIDVAKTTLNDTQGRPRYLLDHQEPIRELL